MQMLIFKVLLQPAQMPLDELVSWVVVPQRIGAVLLVFVGRPVGFENAVTLIRPTLFFDRDGVSLAA